MDLGLHPSRWDDTAVLPNQKISTQLAATCGCVSAPDMECVEIPEDSRLLSLPLTNVS